MVKFLKGKLAGPDDPIFREGPTFYTRLSDRLPAAEVARIQAEGAARRRRRLRAEARAKAKAKAK